MRKLQWNKVTPLSKWIALALFVALPFIGFWWGMQYGETAAYLNMPPAAPGGGGESAYYRNIAAWQVDIRSDANAGFSIAYPLDFDTNDVYSGAPSYDWRVNSGGNPGNLFFTLTIPRAFEPQTNFADAKLTVGSSHNGSAVADCLKPDASGGPAVASTTMTIDGTDFTVFQSNGAGAGNYYETTSYRALHGGACWAVEYTVHSSQIANYPASYELKPFNKSKLTDVLDRVVSTFKFL